MGPLQETALIEVANELRDGLVNLPFHFRQADPAVLMDVEALEQL